MKKRGLNNCKGITLIEMVLMLLITILIIFIVYQIVVVDVLDIMEYGKENSISVLANLNNVSGEQEVLSQKGGENIEAIQPVINENNYQAIETLSSIQHYYYEQLDEPGKIIYKALEDNITNMQSGNYKIDFKTQFSDLLNSEGGDQKLSVAFQSAWNAFTYDYVDIFYIDVTKLILTTQTTSIGNFSKTHKVHLSNGENATYLSDNVTSMEDVQKKKEYISAVRKKIVSQLQGYSKYDQIKYLHDWMVDQFRYDTTYQKENIHNVYGALANKEVVCEGYARTFKYILDGLGIECVLVSGTATNSTGETEAHAWNYVKLNNKWYAIDVTWDDPIIKGGGTLSDDMKYQYFLKGSDEFLKNHEEDGYISSNSIQFVFPTLEEENY